jgi:RNA polymerase sigma factor (sigma-70 family)
MTRTEQENISNTFKNEKGKLLGFIRKRITDNFEAEDILQDVFYQLTIGFRDLDRIENLTAWIYRVTSNKIIDRFRKKKTESLNAQYKLNIDDDSPLLLEEVLPSLDGDPDDALFRELIWEEVQSALNEMPEKHRDVFIWHEFEDKSFKEIAEMTGEGVNTLLSRKRYAILYLREKLNDLYKQLN